MNSARVGLRERELDRDRRIVGPSRKGIGTPARSERRPQAFSQAGFTLVELLIVIGILVIAFLAMSQTLITSMKLTGTNRESACATDGLRNMMETLQGVQDFHSIFRLYNRDPSDDGGAVAPGSNFAVAGLQAVPGDPDGFVGEIVFPTIGTQLREDLVDPALGMPRDLNGDGVIDSLDHALDYRILPVLLRIRWKGGSIERSMEIRTLLANR